MTFQASSYWQYHYATEKTIEMLGFVQTWPTKFLSHVIRLGYLQNVSDLNQYQLPHYHVISRICTGRLFNNSISLLFVSIMYTCVYRMSEHQSGIISIAKTCTVSIRNASLGHQHMKAMLPAADLIMVLLLLFKTSAALFSSFFPTHAVTTTLATVDYHKSHLN